MPKLSPTVRAVLIEERRSQILKAAGKVFAAKGYDRATVRDIARAAGLAQGSLYNYFPSKGDVLIALLRNLIQPQLGSLAATPLGSPEEALTALAYKLLGAARQNAPMARILLTSVPSLPKKMRQQYFEQVVSFGIGMLVAYFQEQIDAGVFRKDIRPHDLAYTFIGMFFPPLLVEMVLEVRPSGALDEDELITSRVRLFLRGVLAIRTPEVPI